MELVACLIWIRCTTVSCSSDDGGPNTEAVVGVCAQDTSTREDPGDRSSLDVETAGNHHAK